MTDEQVRAFLRAIRYSDPTERNAKRALSINAIAKAVRVNPNTVMAWKKRLGYTKTPTARPTTQHLTKSGRKVSPSHPHARKGGRKGNGHLSEHTLAQLEAALIARKESVPAIARRLGTTTQTGYAHLRRLEREGRVARKGAHRKSRSLHRAAA